MDVKKEDIDSLCRAIEQAIDRRLQTPKDFDLLSERIFARTGEMVSRNTLRRIWGRLDEERMPRRSTLSILARFIGYDDFETFMGKAVMGSHGEPSSMPFLGRRLSVLDGLTRGDHLRLTWHPDRVCDVEYNGSQHFRVIHAENTKLQEGDTFLCSIIMEGEQLYLDQLQHGNEPPKPYICGKMGGGTIRTSRQRVVTIGCPVLGVRMTAESLGYPNSRNSP